MFLLHQLFGPLVMFDWIFWAGSHFLEVAWFMAKHYYITSVGIVVMFGYSVAMVFIRWSTQKNERHHREQLLSCVLDQNRRITSLEGSLNRRIQALENNQKEIIRILQELKDRAAQSYV